VSQRVEERDQTVLIDATFCHGVDESLNTAKTSFARVIDQELHDIKFKGRALQHQAATEPARAALAGGEVLA
jgi:hypothetical protein